MSIDELSTEFHIGNNANGSLKNPGRRSANRALHGESRPKASNAEKRRRSHTESSSDNERESLATIRPSKLMSTNRDSVKSSASEFRLRVVKAFSELDIWLFENKDGWYTLTFADNTKELTLYNDDGKQIWTILATQVNKVDYNEDSPKVVLNKSRGQGPTAATRLHLELEDPSKVQYLRERIASSTTVQKIHSVNHLDKIFQTTIVESQKHFRKLRGSKEIPEDVEVMMANSRRRTQRAFEDDQAQRQTRAETSRPRRSIDGTDINRPEGVAKAMKTRPPTDHMQRSEPVARQEAVPPAEFYRPMETRVSTRLSRTSEKESAPPPRASTPEDFPEQWTALNPNWSERWKSSLIYPREGKDKATVDMQDIERLDEGQFLNDNLIIFYLRWLEQHLKVKNPALASRVYIHNTFSTRD